MFHLSVSIPSMPHLWQNCLEFSPSWCASAETGTIRPGWYKYVLENGGLINPPNFKVPWEHISWNTVYQSELKCHCSNRASHDTAHHSHTEHSVDTRDRINILPAAELEDNTASSSLVVVIKLNPTLLTTISMNKTVRICLPCQHTCVRLNRDVCIHYTLLPGNGYKWL